MPVKVAEFCAPAEARGERLDHFLAAELPELSRTRIQQLVRDGHARLEGRLVRRPGLRLHGGERVALEIIARPPLVATPEEIPLQVLYEDDHLIAIDKPAGMVVHAGAGRSHGTLVNALLHRFQQLSAAAGPLRPGIVHRLDKATSGVLLVAKTDEAHRHLAEQFRRREIDKRYLALVHGRMRRARDTIRLPVARDRVHRTRMTTRRRQGREAVTEYRVLQEASGFSLLEVRLRTGRTHQIRVHLSALGHAVVGDTSYGAPRRLRLGNRSLPTLNRNFLHAGSLRLRHPVSGQPLAIRAALPGELEEWLRRLGFKPPV
ncbi:MAG: RluA family pseudouridine synthase [Terriglobia bacterium]